MGKVHRIVLLTLGWEELPKAVSVYGSAPELRLREPVPGVLLQTDGGWVLLDTGFNTALIRDPALYRRFYPTVEYIPVLPGQGEPIEESLHDIGIDVDDIHIVALSHLHHDHAGGVKLFAGKVPVHAQRRELEYGLSNHPSPNAPRSHGPTSTPRASTGSGPTVKPRSRLVSPPFPPTGTRPAIRVSWSSSTTRSAATASCSRSTPPISPRTSRTNSRSAGLLTSSPRER